MKKLIIIVFSAVVTFSATAQNTKKTLELPEFKSIYVNSNYTVMLKQTNKQEVIVEAVADIYDATEVKVENGILMINMERKPDSPNKSVWAKIDDIKVNPTMKVTVSMKQVEGLQVNGGGKIISENSIASDNLSLAVNGSGSMDLDIKGNAVKTEITGSGNLTLKGYATSNEALLAGSGSLKSYTCELESAKVKVSGTGTAELNVTGTLEALSLGSGTVKHKGNTKNVSKKVYGTGAVERAY